VEEKSLFFKWQSKDKKTIGFNTNDSILSYLAFSRYGTWKYLQDKNLEMGCNEYEENL
jgi:hypothetical protein